MSNVINLEEFKKSNEEPKSWGYFEWDDKCIGIESKNTELSIGQFSPESTNKIALEFFDELLVLDRKNMAQLLWAFAFFVDSDQEWIEGQYACLNKDE